MYSMTSVWFSTVQELFGDIGPLKNARLVKPGVADVIFVNVEDALTAVKTYHMRLLDGNVIQFLFCTAIIVWLGGIVVGCWTCDQ